MFVRKFLYSFALCMPLAWAPLAAAPAASGQENNNRETAIDESLESVEEAVEEGVERLSRTLEESTERLAAEFEGWAEEHSTELEDWAEKHSREWEAWAENLEQKLERAAHEQEQVWQRWARRYEKSWEQWADDFEASNTDVEAFGEMIDQNLKMLESMPLSQTIDPLMKEAFRELQDAPWGSLGELGALAEKAVEPLKKLERLDRPEAFDKKTVQLDAKLRALENLLKRDDLTEQQRQKLTHSLRTTRDAKSMLAKQKKSFSSNANSVEEQAVAEKQAILTEIVAEQKRHVAAMKKLQKMLQQEAHRQSPAESEIERLKRQIETLQQELKANRRDSDREE